MIILYVILGLIGAIFIFAILRTIFTKKPVIQSSGYKHRVIDKERVTKHLQEAVRIPTVTLTDNDLDGSIFYEYQAFLERTYPKVMAVAKKTNINKYAAIYKVEGSDSSLLPIGVLAHQDVVPAPSEGWTVPPFSGEVLENCVYGRGSQDMKSQMIAALEGLEILMEEGFIPARGIYFCFGHDEELKGTEGALQISKYLESEGVKFEFVIDEGGTVLDGAILGINNKIALVGTCEKGYADFEIEVAKLGGHASTPTSRTAVGKLAEAVYKIEKNKMPLKWNQPTIDMAKALAPHMNPVFKFMFVNRDLFSPLLLKILSIANPMTNGLIRTTLAPTQAKGADAPNVLPPKATANINCRINIGETYEDAQAHIQKVAGKDLKITMLGGAANPSPVSDITSEAYSTLQRTIFEVFDGFITAPYPFIAASDAKHYYNLTNNVYRFTPFEKTEEDANRIHAIDERQDINELANGTEFFLRLYENACSAKQ
ncbi:MAG: M20/M25/M40 family metallo-hydrolase [Bacillota bacterium]